MDIFDSSYYRMNKFVLSFIGLWPYQDQNSTGKRWGTALIVFGLIDFCLPQKRKDRLALCTIDVLTLLLTLMCKGLLKREDFPQIIYIIKFANNVDRLLTSMPTCIPGIILVTKAFIFKHKITEMRHVLDDIREDWIALSVKKELEILENYAEYTRKYVTCYGLAIFSPVLLFVIYPVTVPILDIISPLNVSRSRMLPHPGEYFVDQDKYFAPILLSQWAGYFAGIFIIYGPDAMYITLIQHCCGLLAILRFYLERITMHEEDLTKNSPEPDVIDYRHAVRCIRLHQKTKKFAELIGSVFTTILSVDILIGVVMHCTSSVLIVVYMDRTDYLIKFGSVLVTLSFRLFLHSWPGQKLMDHSTSIAIAVYNGQWYRTSAKTRRLLLFLMMDSQRPVTLTFAKLYVINLDSFGMIMKTSLSYCTVVASIHEASAY